MVSHPVSQFTDVMKEIIPCDRGTKIRIEPLFQLLVKRGETPPSYGCLFAVVAAIFDQSLAHYKEHYDHLSKEKSTNKYPDQT